MLLLCFDIRISLQNSVITTLCAALYEEPFVATPCEVGEFQEKEGQNSQVRIPMLKFLVVRNKTLVDH